MHFLGVALLGNGRVPTYVNRSLGQLGFPLAKVRYR